MDTHSPASTPSPPPMHGYSNGPAHFGHTAGAMPSGPSGLASGTAAVLGVPPSKAHAVAGGPSVGAAGAGVPASKRDRRRHNLSERYTALTTQFSQQKEVLYHDMLSELQGVLSALHAGTDATLLERITDLEEERDAELVTLFLNEQFLEDRAEKEYERDVAAAEEDYANMAKAVREKLLARLETQRRKLREDKELLDIANDHAFLLSVAGYHAPGSPSSSGMMGSVGERRKNLRRRNENAGGATGLASIADSMLGSLGSGGGISAAAASAAAKKRKRLGGKGADRDEIAQFWSNREALPFGHTREDLTSNGNSTSGSGSGSGKHREKPFGGITGLKSEEVNEDLAILRKKKKRK
ncbi:Sds3-like-domain-containing protein [Limtongia smithiae]|uniref:Sds3-like-domain-containing protein n=1 Tax=Limtongia smithiae TaxID=1125753 RepID=UPI0034CECDAD